MPTTSGITPELPADVKLWSVNELTRFLTANADTLQLKPEHIRAIGEQDVDGTAMLEMTTLDLTSCGIPVGTAVRTWACVRNVFRDRHPAPSTISPAQAAELARLRELEEKVSKSIQTFHIILKPRGPAATAWLVNTNTVTFDDLAEEITQIYRPVSKTDLFTFETNGSRVTAPITDGNLRVLFQTLAARNERTVTIDVKSELKIFSEFKMEEVCKLYGLLYDSRNPLSQFPAFQCTADHVDDNLVCYVMEELNSRTRLTPVVMAPAAHQSVYVYCILHAIGRSSNFDFMVLAERFVEGSKAKGNVDYSIVSRGGLILGVIEVMRQGDIQGIAQNAMQIRSALEYNRKRNPAHVRCFGIATDANFWYFLEYFPDQTPRVSGRYQVMFQGKFVVGAVRKVMGIISWLLKAEPVMSEPQRKRMRLGGVS